MADPHTTNDSLEVLDGNEVKKTAGSIAKTSYFIPKFYAVDGDIVTLGAKADAAATANDADASINARLRRLTIDTDSMKTNLNNLGTDYTIGTAYAGTEAGPLVTGVRDDELATLSDPDGDIVAGRRVNARGAEWIALDGLDLSDTIQVTPSCHTSPVTAADVLADTEVLAAVTRGNDIGAILQDLTVWDVGDQGLAIDIWLLRANHQIGTEGGLIDITTTEAKDIVFIQQITSADWVDNTTHRYFHSGAIGKPFDPVTGTDDLYIGIVAREAGTFGASDIVVEIGVLKN